MDFITTFFHCVRRTLPRFLQKLSFDKKLAEKPKSSIFEMISGFCSFLIVKLISTFLNCQNPLEFFSRFIVSSRGEQARNWAQGPKTRNFKVLCFKPNFRERLNITSEGIPWPHSIKKHLTKLFIHDWSEEHAFPQVLSPNHTSSSKFSPMVSKFRDLDSSLF